MATLGFVGCGVSEHGDAGADAGGTHAGESSSHEAGAETMGGTSAGGSDRASAGDVSGGGRSGDGDAGTAPISALPGDAVFTRDGFLDVRLTLDEAVWKDLEEHGDLEEYVEASAEISRAGGPSATFGKLGVRHKGAYSLHHCWDDFGGVRSHEGTCAKLSYKLNFDKYQKGSAFDGLERLNLHAASGDASKLRELVAYQAFRDAGIETARAIPARLFINDQPQGVFIAVEDIDEQFLAAHYPGAADGLSSDKVRQVRIRVASPAYDDTFGGVWQEFGAERFVGPTPTDVSIDFASLYYPPWARDGWSDTVGFPDGDDAAKAVVLSRMNGVIFAPAATFDGAGELTGATEAGWLRVDNVYLR